MEIDKVNTSNLDKYLEGYPENVKTALKKLCLCYDGEGEHIVKYYKIGYFGVPEGLQRELKIRQYPQKEILKKYYPELGYLGNVSMTLSFNRDTGRISPAYYDNDTGRFYSFTEEMIANTAMWDEMANVKLSLPTIEYAEEKPLDEQYEEWKRCNDKSNNYYAEYLAEKEKNRLLKDKGTYTYKLSMAALIVLFVALIINLIIA